MNGNDELFQCFEAHLLQLDIEHESHADFISNVVESYLQRLRDQGHICLQFELELRDDIELEVVTMLRKKIYGHFNLDQFRFELRKRKNFHS